MTSTIEKPFLPSFRIGESVIITDSQHQQLYINDVGIVVDILIAEKGYGVQFIKDFKDATERVMEKHRLIIFFKENQLKPLMTQTNGAGTKIP